MPANKTFVDDYREMHYAFNADLSKSFKPQLERVLNMDVKTLIYNGQNDFIVNTAGVLTYLNTLKWKNAKEWRDAKSQCGRITMMSQTLAGQKTTEIFTLRLSETLDILFPPTSPESPGSC